MGKQKHYRTAIYIIPPEKKAVQPDNKTAPLPGIYRTGKKPV